MTDPTTDSTGHRWKELRWPLFVLVLSSAVQVALVELAIGGSNPRWDEYRMIDLDIYATSIRKVLDGQDLYSFEPWFTYPPFALIALLPLGVIPMGLLTPLFGTLKVVILHVGAWLYLGSRGLSGRRRLVWAVVAGWVGATFVDPTGQDISHGQVNILLMAIVAADLLGARGSRWRGVGVGIATGIKLVPGLFIVYLLVTRQVRAAAVATVTFAATVAIGFVVLPRPAWEYWTSVLWDNTRVWEKPEVVLNQTVHGVVIRALGHDNTVLWMSLALLVAGVGLAVAAALHRQGAEVASVTAVGLTASVVTPQGWIHHWVWLAPALLVLAVGAGRSVRAWLGLVALFLFTNSRPYYLIGDPWRHDALHLSATEQVLAANLVLTLVILLIVVGLAWLRRTPPPPAPLVTGEPRQTHADLAR